MVLILQWEITHYPTKAGLPLASFARVWIDETLYNVWCTFQDENKYLVEVRMFPNTHWPPLSIKATNRDDAMRQALEHAESVMLSPMQMLARNVSA